MPLGHTACCQLRHAKSELIAAPPNVSTDVGVSNGKDSRPTVGRNFHFLPALATREPNSELLWMMKYNAC